LAASAELAAFLNELEITTIQILSDGKNMKILPKELAMPPANIMEVHVIKLAKDVLTIENIK
jgi:hypothetical protein